MSNREEVHETSGAIDYDLNDRQDCARFQVNLALAELDRDIADHLQVVYREDLPPEVVKALNGLYRALQEVDRVTQPGYKPTVKDLALDALGR